jgi:cytochrome c peroxidase
MRPVCAILLSLAALAATRRVPLGLDLYMPVPDHNPLTAEKIALGRRLFFDRRLSRDGSLACATCHDPKRAFSDGRKVAVGVFGRQGRRNAPAIINGDTAGSSSGMAVPPLLRSRCSCRFKTRTRWG